MVIPDNIQFRYFLADRHHPVTPNARRWDEPLPAASEPAGLPARRTGLTYGHYFTAVSQFIAQNRFALLLKAAARHLRRDVTESDISKIDIYLEKHGQFYHPARLEAIISADTLTRVVNVAVSRDGRACLTHDVRNIQRLQAAYPYNFLPRLDDCTDVPTAAGDGTLTMALGEWLNGFNEFHFSVQPDADHPVLMVWNPVNCPTRLSEEYTRAVFRQAARILTAYLNIESFEVVQNWHNAAGDFVIRQQGGKIRVRLVTVRRYAPLFGDLAVTADNILDLLVVYLISTSLRLGLDRLDGTGAPVWAGNMVLSAALEGCLDGLQLQVEHGLLPVELVGAFIRHLRTYRVEELDELCCDIVSGWPAAMIGRDLIPCHQGSLGAAFSRAFYNLDPRH